MITYPFRVKAFNIKLNTKTRGHEVLSFKTGQLLQNATPYPETPGCNYLITSLLHHPAQNQEPRTFELWNLELWNPELDTLEPGTLEPGTLEPGTLEPGT